MQKEDWCLVVDYRNKGAAKQDIENANDIEILQKIVEPCIFRTFQFASKTKFRLIALLENEENLRKYFNIEDDCNKPKMFFIFLLSHGTENLLHHERKVGDPSSSSSQKSINEKSGNEDVYEACSRNRFIDSTLIILFQETTRVVRPEKNKKNIVKRISVDQSARNNFGYINTCIEPKSHASFYSVSWLVKAVVDTAKYMKKDTPMHILLTKVCVKTLSLCPDQTLELKFPALNRQNVFKRSAVKDDSNSPPDHTKYNDAYEVKKKFKLAINLHRMFTFPYDFDEKNEVKSKDLVESGFYLNSNTEKICCYFCDLISDVKEWRGLNFAEILDRHHKLSPDCRIMYSNSDNVSHEVSRGSIGNRNFYKYETYRLYSLIKHMEHWNYVKPSDMAAWGFYYVGPGDSVQCFSCNLILSSWEQNDSAKSEHIRWNADCPFLRSNGSYCNVVIGEENLNSDSTCDCAHGRRSHTPTPPRPVQPEFTRQYGPRVIAKAPPNFQFLVSFGDDSEMGMIYQTPTKFSSMKSAMKRESSFTSNNENEIPAELIESLVNCGFFYQENSNKVSCYDCGLSFDPTLELEILYDIEMEHAKRSPECTYSLIRKSEMNENLSMNVECSNCQLIENAPGELICYLPCGHVHRSGCFETSEECNKCGKAVYGGIKMFF